MLSQVFTSFWAKLNLAVVASMGVVATTGMPVTASESPLADGVYLYGQAPQPEVIGSEYLVFEVENGEAQGAIYYPASEFNCFTADINNQSMNLAIVDPFDRAVYPYEIAVNMNGDIAGRDRATLVAELEGYHELEAISNNDRRILETCQNDL